ncbi:hypothetical protein [Streptomyces sp. NBC_00354]
MVQQDEADGRRAPVSAPPAASARIGRWTSGRGEVAATAHRPAVV